VKALIFSFFKKQWRIKILDRIENIVHTMSLAEKVAWYVALFVFTASSLTLLSNLNDQFMVTVPAHGGTINEGLVGTPRFVNPLLDISDTDRSLSQLIYSGLMRATPEGKIIPDLAESYTVSSDGLSYTFIIKKDAKWSDGEPITTNDIEFTILKAQDSSLKSPRRVAWEGISIEKKSEQEIVFTLRQPYYLFLENTTLGILPKHIWKSIEVDEFPFSQFNIEPVGSGPYVVTAVNKNSNGIPSSYELKSNRDYSLGEPFIKNININFYQNEKSAIEAYENGDVENLSGVGPSYAKNFEAKKTEYRSAPFSRIFGIFFNQNQNEVLLNKEVRQALNVVLEKEKLVNDVLYGFGEVATGAFPKIETITNISTSTSTSTPADIAEEILTKAGWKINPDTNIFEKKTKTSTQKLSISISTSNIPELVQTARIVEEAWKSINVEVDVRIFESSDLNQNVIRPRKYDSLLFGIVTGRNPDLYAFWHSSQRNDPGLNIALYTNTKVDKLLEDMRKTRSEEERALDYKTFEQEIEKDIPALFLYTPEFIYIVPDEIQNLKLGTITTPSDRFANIYEWYLETDRVWTIFADEKYIKEKIEE
jgi:peptide/nickel transport system substrate-binding protein